MLSYGQGKIEDTYNTKEHATPVDSKLHKALNKTADEIEKAKQLRMLGMSSSSDSEAETLKVREEKKPQSKAAKKEAKMLDLEDESEEEEQRPKRKAALSKKVLTEASDSEDYDPKSDIKKADPKSRI